MNPLSLSRTGLAVAGLSLSVWMLVYCAMPAYPLSREDMQVVVPGCALLVVAAQWVWNALRRRVRHA